MSFHCVWQNKELTKKLGFFILRIKMLTFYCKEKNIYVPFNRDIYYALNKCWINTIIHGWLYHNSTMDLMLYIISHLIVIVLLSLFHHIMQWSYYLWSRPYFYRIKSWRYELFQRNIIVTGFFMPNKHNLSSVVIIWR